MKCKNCERGDYKFRRGYCTKCYSLILRIDKISQGKDSFFILDSLAPEEINKINCEKIRQLKKRLEDLRDSYVIRKKVTAHKLENQINSTLKDLGKKGIGKFNDQLEFGLKEKLSKEFVYQLFALIKISNRFSFNINKFWDILCEKKIN